MPLIFSPPRSITGSALTALRGSRSLIHTGGSGFTLVGGRLPNADGNLPPDTIGDGGVPNPFDTPPGTDEGSTGAPAEEEQPAVEPESLMARCIGWVKTPSGMLTTTVAAAAATYAVYQYGKSRKTKKSNRGRR